jgi:hypothetical protein
VFLALSALYLVLFQHSQAATAVMFQHLHFVVLFWLFVLVFSTAIQEVIVALAACTVSIALLNWVEFFYPLATNLFDCRAVGMYLNPNGAAYALVFGMLAGLRAFPVRAKPWFVMVAGISILPTYSRSGMIIYVVAMLVLLASGMINWRRLMLPALVGAGVIILLFSLALINVGGRHDCVAHSIGDRGKAIHFSSTDLGSAESDYSTQSRVTLVRQAYSEYRASWLFGRGLDLTSVWKGGQRSHNIYLEKGIEMGIAGLLIWPAFLLSLALSIHGRSRKWACDLLIVSTGLVLGLFSHNLFESRQILIAAALLLVTSADRSTR